MLLIYDCCHAVPTTTGVTGRGVKEFLAACGFEGRAAEVGPDSFTFALTQELGRASYSPVSVCELYARLIDRLRTWKPCISTNESGQMRFNSAGKPLFERSRRTTPIHCTLTNEHKRRSIVLTPMPEDWMTETRPMKNKVVRPQDDEKYAPKEINECPQVILSVRVDTEQFNIDTWLEWIKDVPPEATKVKVEGVYGSLSTLLLLRMPITTWKLLPDDAAYSFVGFVTTENLISDLREQELTAALTSVDLKKRYVYDPSDPIQPVSNYSIKTEMELRDVKNAEKMASKGTATGTADDAADWTRDLMLMLHVEFQHQEQLANFIIELSRDYPFEPTEDKQRIQSILFDVLHFKLQQHKELASLISDLMHPMDQFDRFVNRVHQ